MVRRIHTVPEFHRRGARPRCLVFQCPHGTLPRLPARAAAVAARHVGRRTCFVDEHQALRVQAALARTPLIAGLSHIRRILLGRSLRLFLSGSLRNFSLFHSPMLTVIRCSAEANPESSSVASGQAATRARSAYRAPPASVCVPPAHPCGGSPRSRADSQELCKSRKHSPEYRRNSISPGAGVHRRHHAITQVLRVRLAHRHPRAELSGIQNPHFTWPRNPSDFR